MVKIKKILDNILKNKWKILFILTGLGIIIYGRTIFFGWSYLDDNTLILNNLYFLSNWTNIFKSFSIDVFHLFNNSAFYYRPILIISFIFDYHLGGSSPYIYHFSNIIYHIIASYLVFIFLVKLNYKKIISFIFSIIFLVHPVLTEAVAWVPGRNDTLLTIFVLAAFIFFINYLNNEKAKNLLWSIVFMCLAFFTKENAIFILPVMLFYFYFIYKGQKKLIKKYYPIIGSILLLGVWFLLRHLALLGSPTLSVPEMFKSIIINSPGAIQLIGKIIFPFNLSVLPIMADTTFAYGVISSILIFITYIFTKGKRWNYVLFGLGWFLIFLLPAFIRPDISLQSDFIQHRLYLPIIGFFILILETDLIKRINWKKKNPYIIFSIIIVTFSIISIIFSSNFSSKLKFWENAVANSPDYSLAHKNLGAMDYLDGNMQEAEKEFKEALKLNPNEQMAHNNLGLIYSHKGKDSQALAEYKKEITINPYYDNVYFNLGLLHWKEGEKEKAINNFKKTLDINPNYLDAIMMLETYYYNNKDYNEALPYAYVLYNRGVQIQSDMLQKLKLSVY